MATYWHPLLAQFLREDYGDRLEVYNHQDGVFVRQKIIATQYKEKYNERKENNT
jgi:hypothetical protein